MERKTLAANVAPLLAELRACERVLGCIIEGVGPEQLLIRYSIKGGDSMYEASFVLDVSSPSYKGASCEHDAWMTYQYLIVLTSTPLLPTLPTLLDHLTESRDVYTFIKRVRQAYVKMFS
jgi:kinetochore protein Spc25